MCGIAGRLNFATRRPVPRELLRGMCDLLAHRGPDGWDVYADGPIGLAHRRLAVIDLTAAGTQPMATADGQLRITFNGEIYNFRALRTELEDLGHRFRSRTDTEVILAAYREWDVSCLNRLRGMFAFAIWDGPRDRLFVARDRLGQKPVHYWIDADGLSFASEPKAFLADPGFTPEADPAAIAHYLTFQYVPTPFSAFRGVRKLPPGSYLLVEDGQVRVERYWRLQYGRKNRLSEAEAAEELRARIAEAVRLRLVSDVPLGAFLSGGIDSGIVVAMMAQQAGGRVKTFSIGFDQKEYDELPAARLVAERYGTEHHEFVVRPDALALLPALVWHYNEPYADSSAIPTFVLSELTRRYVTVALNGDAGDENFAGYERYVANALGSRIDRIPRPLRRFAARAAARIPGKRAPRSVLGRAKRLVEAAGEDRAQRYVRWMSHFHSELRRDVCQPEFLTTAGVDPERQLLDAYEESDAPDLVDATLDLDVRTYLPDDLLVKVDIATMAHGLEARSPFLDHELMEFAAALPSRYKLHGLVKKYILRKAGEPLLPAHILERPKMGFGVPIDAWFRGALKPVVYDLIGSTRFRDRGVLRPERVARMLDEHARGVRSWHYQLWNVLMLELWYRAFIDQRPAAFADVAAAIGPLIVLPAA